MINVLLTDSSIGHGGTSAFFPTFRFYCLADPLEFIFMALLALSNEEVPAQNFPNFSIKKWFPKFLNQKMVSQNFSIKKWFPKFLNQKMVSQISQSKNGFPNFSIKKWFHPPKKQKSEIENYINIFVDLRFHPPKKQKSIFKIWKTI